MTKPVPMDTPNSLTILLLNKAPYFEVMNMLPNVWKTQISRHNKRFFDGAHLTNVGKKIRITKKTQLYIANSIWNNKVDKYNGGGKVLAS